MVYFIKGRDKRTGRPYEDLYCGNSKPMGVAALGDSVTAHFHIPYEWANSSLLNQVSGFTLFIGIPDCTAYFTRLFLSNNFSSSRRGSQQSLFLFFILADCTSTKKYKTNFKYYNLHQDTAWSCGEE